MFVAIIDDTKPVKPSTAICQRPGTSWRFMPPSMNSHRMIAAAPIHTALVVSHTSFPPAANSFAIGSTVNRSEEHTSELQSLMRISYAVFCLKKKTRKQKLQQTEFIRRYIQKQTRKHTQRTR